MREILAENYFKNGYNCAQSVLLAFKDVVKVDEENLTKLSMPFGGGICGLKDICGAVSGMLMVSGLILAGTNNSKGLSKPELFGVCKDFMAKFKEKFSSIDCYDLTQVKCETLCGHKAICFDYVKQATLLLENYLIENSLI